MKWEDERAAPCTTVAFILMGEQRQLSYRKQTRDKRSSFFVGRPWHPNRSTLGRNLCSIKCNGFDSVPALMGNTLLKH